MSATKNKENKSQKPENTPSPKAVSEGPTNCSAKDCKSKQTRFGFCGEHFNQFKFGLINKEGKKVPDYDKKFEHYQAQKERLKQVA